MKAKPDRVREYRPKGFEDHMAGVRHYSDKDINVIIGAVPGGLPATPIEQQRASEDGSHLVPRITPRREALIWRLETAAAWHAIEHAAAGKPPPSELAESLDTIEAAARRLLAALRVPKDGTADQIPAALGSPLRLMAEQMGKERGGYPHHPPLPWQVPNSSDTYMDYFGAEQMCDAVEGVRQIATWSSMAAEKVRQRIDRQGKRYRGQSALDALFGDLARVWLEVFEQPRIATSATSDAGKASGPFIRFLKACLGPLGTKPTDEAIRERARKLFQGRPTRSLAKGSMGDSIRRKI